MKESCPSLVFVSFRSSSDRGEGQILDPGTNEEKRTFYEQLEMYEAASYQGHWDDE
jgi:hypothetical protein